MADDSRSPSPSGSTQQMLRIEKEKNWNTYLKHSHEFALISPGESIKSSVFVAIVLISFQCEIKNFIRTNSSLSRSLLCCCCLPITGCLERRMTRQTLRIWRPCRTRFSSLRHTDYYIMRWKIESWQNNIYSANCKLQLILSQETF